MGAAGFPGEGTADGGTIATLILRQATGLPAAEAADDAPRAAMIAAWLGYSGFP